MRYDIAKNQIHKAAQLLRDKEDTLGDPVAMARIDAGAALAEALIDIAESLDGILFIRTSAP